MMLGKYRQGQQELPRVVEITIVRFRPELPEPDEELGFLVSIHEEGRGVIWQQNVALRLEYEETLLEATRDLYLWSVQLANTPEKARSLIRQIAGSLHSTLIGEEGGHFLENLKPTAVLLGVDETILNLPWELMGAHAEPLSQRVPFGRVVATRVIPRPGRDPTQEDGTIRILAVGNPTGDLGAAQRQIEAMSILEDRHQVVTVETLLDQQATREAFIGRVSQETYDIVHFAGHATFDSADPGINSVLFSDGPLTANEVLNLQWAAPPYVVFNSACQSGLAVGGWRLVSGERANGLAAAFIASGVEAYAGYFWPVTDTGAAMFSRSFYESLFERENVGLAFLDARRRVARELEEVADLTSYSAILFGDAASQHRRDLMTAA